jgi:ubiquinone/menaquinone biosynthesis C-methylase UbiE
MSKPDRATSVRHPVFARVYERVAAAAEKAGASAHRDALLAGLSGRVVELGAGTGLNFGHYPNTVDEVVAVEPERYLHAKAAQAAADATVRVTLVDGTANAIPLPDASVDAAVASLVLCSVPDQLSALAELRRVVRPGGDMFVEAQLAAENPRWSRLQQRLDPVWSWFAGGCHVTRHTEEAISAAGFDIESCERFLFQPGAAAKLAAPHILGRARRRSTERP